VNFVVDHVFESLLESGTDKNGVVELHASLPVEHDFVAVALLLLPVQVFCDVVDRDTFGKGCCVSLAASQRGHLARQTLHHVSDGHPRRNGMRVHDQIGYDSLLSEWHIFLTVGNAHGAFLTMSRCEFVTDLRHSHNT